MGTGCAAAASTTFRDDSSNDILNASAPYVGSFFGERTSLSGLDDGPQGSATVFNGTWRLRVSFLDRDNPGVLNCWSLDVLTVP
jgi:hypothetical protein